jgi:NhaP-type Na+/H+ or K+/H+ antiporter
LCLDPCALTPICFVVASLVISGYVLEVFPHHDVSFDGNWFLRILVPPIIFQAALSIDKRSFNRHIVPILMFAVVGTLMATFLTAVVVHYGTTALSRWCEPIPYVEALTFGALISSIDPIAVLSVLSNMGMNDTDTIYVLIFGESLLNDGVAIVLFHTLVHFLDEKLIIDREAIAAAAIHFLVVAFGSLMVGVASGIMSTVYFWAFYGCQTPLVEVLMFMCWALLPYYVCDGIGWSGIVAAVAVGFVMDLHIVGQNRFVEDEGAIFDVSERTSASYDSNSDLRPRLLDRGRRQVFNRYGHLSGEAKAHVGFVTEIIATGMETAIFAYLGFFLFSHRYHWNGIHMITAIIGCCCSRAIMIPALSLIANGITRLRQSRGVCRTASTAPLWKANNVAGVIVDKKMQVALWFAGLRGAMSFALVESIPLYDSFSGEGTRLKPELKAMTSGCIMFTVFILGGYTYYILDRLGISPNNRRSSPANGYELSALLSKGHELDSDEDGTDRTENDKCDNTKPSAPGSAFRRQRHTQGDTMLTI